MKEKIWMVGQEANGAAAAGYKSAIKVMTPEDIARKATEKRSEKQEVGKWVKAGEFEKLTLIQLQDDAKQRGISVYRNKDDLIRMLAPLEPKVDWETIKWKTLLKRLNKHKISSMKSKEELVQMLKNKYALLSLNS